MDRVVAFPLRVVMRLAFTLFVVLLARPVLWCFRRQLRICVICAEAVLWVLAAASDLIDNIEHSLAGTSTKEGVQDGRRAILKKEVVAGRPVEPLEGSGSTACIISPTSSTSPLASDTSSPSQSPKEERKFLASGAEGSVFSEGGKAVKVRGATNWSDSMDAFHEFHMMVQRSTNCSNILGAESLTFDSSTAALKMELCEGDVVKWLGTIWGSTPFEDREALAVEFLKQAGTGLEALHKAGIVHADIKPKNILFREYPKNWQAGIAGDVFKISDFGLAYGQHHAASTFLARGTTGFMAPEMAAYSPKAAADSSLPGTACDMWSLGLTFGCFLSGQQFNFEDINANKVWLDRLTPQSRRIFHGLTRTDPEKRLTASALLSHEDLVHHKLAIPRLQ